MGGNLRDPNFDSGNHKKRNLMKSMLAIISICLFLSACVTGDKVRSLQPGLTQQQVIARLGKPDGFYSQPGNVEILRYSNQLMSGWSWDRADYDCVLKDGKLVSYGPSTVRQNRPPVNSVLLLTPNL